MKVEYTDAVIEDAVAITIMTVPNVMLSMSELMVWRWDHC